MSDEELSSFAGSMRREFDDWKNDLPAGLVVDVADTKSVCLPHVLQLQ
jgi:hypothetical protein